jgi:hypothetical protein
MPVHREVVNGLLLDSIAYDFTPSSVLTGNGINILDVSRVTVLARDSRAPPRPTVITHHPLPSTNLSLVELGGPFVLVINCNL